MLFAQRGDSRRPLRWRFKKNCEEADVPTDTQGSAETSECSSLSKIDQHEVYAPHILESYVHTERNGKDEQKNQAAKKQAAS
jgi:hypothetical protein